MRRDVSPLNEDMIAQRYADRVTSRGGLCGRILPALDRGHARRLMMRRKEQLHADLQCPRFDSPHEHPAILRAIDVLDRKTQRLLGGGGRRFQLVDRLEQTHPAKPAQRWLAIARDIYSRGGRYRHERASLHAEAFQKSPIFSFYPAELRLGVAHQVHLVHRHNDLANPEQA